MDSLPNDLIPEIVKHVTLWDFKQLAPTCYRLNIALHEDKLWQQLCESYDVLSKDNDYLRAIKTKLEDTKKWQVEGCKGEKNILMKDENARVAIISWPELINLKAKCGVKIHSTDTIFYCYCVGDTIANRYYPLIIAAVDDGFVLINGIYKFNQKAGDEVKIAHNFKENRVEIYYNDDYIDYFQLKPTDKPCKLTPLLYLHKGIIEPF